MKGLCFTMDVKPYRYGLAVSIGQSVKDLERFARNTDKLFGCDHAKEVIEVVQNGQQRGDKGLVIRWGADAFLWLAEFPKCTASYGVLVHELLHVTSGVMKSRNIRLSNIGTEEAFAYLQEYLYIEISNRVYEHLHDRR